MSSVTVFGIFGIRVIAINPLGSDSLFVADMNSVHHVKADGTAELVAGNSSGSHLTLSPQFAKAGSASDRRDFSFNQSLRGFAINETDGSVYLSAFNHLWRLCCVPRASPPPAANDDPGHNITINAKILAAVASGEQNWTFSGVHLLVISGSGEGNLIAVVGSLSPPPPSGNASAVKWLAFGWVNPSPDAQGGKAVRIEKTSIGLGGDVRAAVVLNGYTEEGDAGSVVLITVLNPPAIVGVRVNSFKKTHSTPLNVTSKSGRDRGSLGHGGAEQQTDPRRRLQSELHQGGGH